MSSKPSLGSCIVFMCLLIPVIGFAAERPQNVVLIGWDGAQRDHVNECLARNELPSLQRLIDGGKYVKIDVEGKTDTKAGWSQILTGYYPEVTGVYSNGRFQPVPEGLSLFERLEKHFGSDKFVTAAVIGKRAHCGEINPPRKIRLDEQGKPVEDAAQKARAKKQPVQPGAARQPKGTIIEENGVKYRYIPGSPYLNMYKALEVWEIGLTQDERVGTRAIELLDKYKDKPFFFFVHFAEVDHSGHQRGENSKEYNDALISNDLWTGRIMDKLKELGLADKTTIYVTADHGFNEDAKGHGFAPYIFMATNNKAVCRDGRRQDITPTILDDFGLDLDKCEPKLDGIAMTKAETRPEPKIGPAKPAAKKKAAAKQSAGVKKQPARQKKAARKKADASV